MGMFGDGGSHDDYLKLEARVASLEATVVQLSAALSRLGASGESGAPGAQPVVAAGYPWLPEVLALKQRGKLIEAIKVAREHTGWDLRQTKDFVEGL